MGIKICANPSSSKAQYLGYAISLLRLNKTTFIASAKPVAIYAKKLGLLVQGQTLDSQLFS